MFDLAFISPIPIFRPNTCLGQNHCRRRPFPVITSAALLSPEISRRQSLRVLLSGIATLSIAPALITHAEDEVKTASGLTYTVVKKGDGPQPNVGDLIAIRFRGSYNGVVFDDIFKTSEPYFYRLGSGSILKGIDEALQKMHVGDVYTLKIPGDLAFGKKGRRASSGKPSIPPNATVEYEVALVEFPGRQDELLELTGGTDESNEELQQSQKVY